MLCEWRPRPVPGKVLHSYGDFRELVARPDIDVVSVASTDHWHVLHALAAVRSGKDVYVEKPLGISLQQIKTLRDEVHRYGRMFQFGTQQRSMPQFHQACELVLNGRIGKLHTMRVSAPPGFAERTGESGYPIMPPPDDVDYDMWLGPRPGHLTRPNALYRRTGSTSARTHWDTSQAGASITSTSPSGATAAN